jgi:hypothetical protein
MWNRRNAMSRICSQLAIFGTAAKRKIWFLNEELPSYIRKISKSSRSFTSSQKGDPSSAVVLDGEETKHKNYNSSEQVSTFSAAV